MPDVKKESFEEFKNSFAYGSRTDLNFKFLAGLTNQEAGKFVQDLLWKLGDVIDDGQFVRIVEHIYEWQVHAYAGAGNCAYEEGPFAPLKRPLSESRLVLISSSGHFVEGEDPEPLGIKNMTQAEAAERILQCIRSEPTLSAIPVGTPREKLVVRHGGYDVRGARTDPNVVFPHEIMVDLEEEGVIGELAPKAYSFVGACSQRRLLNESGPEWVRLLQEKDLDAALLVPV